MDKVKTELLNPFLEEANKFRKELINDLKELINDAIQGIGQEADKLLYKAEKIVEGMLARLTDERCLYTEDGSGKEVFTSGKFSLDPSIGLSSSIVDAILHKQWKPLADIPPSTGLQFRQRVNYDLALLRLGEPIKVPGTRYLKPAAEPTNEFVGSVAGYGRVGNGLKGTFPVGFDVNGGGVDDQIDEKGNPVFREYLLAGKNQMRRFTSSYTAIVYDLDTPTSSSRFNPDFLSATPLEAIPMNGDSGGPVMFGSSLIGIVSRGDNGTVVGCGRLCTRDYDKYGGLEFDAALSPHLGWISQVIVFRYTRARYLTLPRTSNT